MLGGGGAASSGAVAQEDGDVTSLLRRRAPISRTAPTSTRRRSPTSRTGMTARAAHLNSVRLAMPVASAAAQIGNHVLVPRSSGCAITRWLLNARDDERGLACFRGDSTTQPVHRPPRALGRVPRPT